MSRSGHAPVTLWSRSGHGSRVTRHARGGPMSPGRGDCLGCGAPLPVGSRGRWCPRCEPAHSRELARLRKRASRSRRAGRAPAPPLRAPSSPGQPAQPARRDGEGGHPGEEPERAAPSEAVSPIRISRIPPLPTDGTGDPPFNRDHAQARYDELGGRWWERVLLTGDREAEFLELYWLLQFFFDPYIPREEKLQHLRSARRLNALNEPIDSPSR